MPTLISKRPSKNKPEKALDSAFMDFSLGVVKFVMGYATGIDYALIPVAVKEDHISKANLFDNTGFYSGFEFTIDQHEQHVHPVALYPCQRIGKFLKITGYHQSRSVLGLMSKQHWIAEGLHDYKGIHVVITTTMCDKAMMDFGKNFCPITNVRVLHKVDPSKAKTIKTEKDLQQDLARQRFKQEAQYLIESLQFASIHV